MRFPSVFLKSAREQVRNIWVLLLTLAFAPVFVYAYWLFFPSGGSTSYKVLVINEDMGVETDGRIYAAGQEAIEAIRQTTYANGSPLLEVETVADRASAEELVRDRKGVVYIVFPEDFSVTVLAVRNQGEPSTTGVIFGGDLTNPYYMIAAILATTAVDEYVHQATGLPPVIQYQEEALGGSGSRTEFEVYVPGMFIFAIELLIFTAAMTFAREVEDGTLRRLKLSRVSSFELLGGVSLVLVIVGTLAEGLALVTALALGFHSYGPIWVALLIGVVTCFSVIGVGAIVASFSKTVAQTFVIANFPLGLFMFFSGVIFPIPSVTLFSVAGQPVGLYDVLPPRHAVIALNKIMTLGMGLRDVQYELVSLLVLSALYFVVGAWVFQHRHMRVA